MNMPIAVEPNSSVPSFGKDKPVLAMMKQIGIADLLAIDGVTEVAINRPGEIWYQRNGVWAAKHDGNITFDLCRKLANGLAVNLSENSDQLAESPICPVTFPSGERGQIVIPPATEKECISFTIRKPSRLRFSLEEYESSGRLSNYSVIEKQSELADYQKEMLMCVKESNMRRFLELAVYHKLNVVCGGSTGSGKTTFTKAFVDLYPPDRRYITIEDVPELDMPNHPNRVHMFFENKKGKASKGNGVTADQLVRSCVRMKPDHIFMSELKGEETWSYLSLLNTGHNGSVTTAHFNDSLSCIPRLTNIVQESDAGKNLSYEFVYREIQKSIDVVLYWENSYLTEVLYNPEEKMDLLRRAT